MSSLRTLSYSPIFASPHRNCMSAAVKRWKYLRKMLKFGQMDFEFAFWQMMYLFMAPQKVYRNFHHRKKTKSQFARDDPAFLVLFAAWLCVASIGFAMKLGLSVWKFINLLIYFTFVSCIGTGFAVATSLWFILNKYCRYEDSQDIEWGFAFDIHLNACFPQIIIQHVYQLFFNSFTNHESVIRIYLGNTVWLIAISYYIYITFLGYHSLQVIQHNHLLLMFLSLLFLFYIISLVSGISVTFYY